MLSRHYRVLRAPYAPRLSRMLLGRRGLFFSKKNASLKPDELPVAVASASLAQGRHCILYGRDTLAVGAMMVGRRPEGATVGQAELAP